MQRRICASFWDPRDFNSYGYSDARLCWTGFSLRANIVEKYVLLSAVLQVIVALKRTRVDQRSGRSSTPMILLLAFCGHPCRGKFARLSWHPETSTVTDTVTPVCVGQGAAPGRASGRGTCCLAKCCRSGFSSAPWSRLSTSPYHMS